MKGPIARATVRTSAVLGLRLLVQTGTLLLVSRLLGPRQYGAFAGVASLAVTLGALSSFGMPLVVLGEMSRDPARRGSVLAYAVPTTVLFGGALLALYLLVCGTVLSRTGIATATLAAIGLTEIVLQPLFALPAAEHHALGRIARAQLLNLLPLVLRLLAALSVFLAQPAHALDVYAAGYLAASLVALAIAAITLPAPWPGWRQWRLPRPGELGNAGGYAALNLTSASPAELDKTLAARLLPLPDAGLYSAGARIIGAATLPVIAMLLSASPRLFREGLQPSSRTLRLLAWMSAAALAYSLALAAALWFAAPAFPWVFGARYQGIDRVIRWLCPAIPGLALRRTMGSILMTMGKPWMRVGFELAGLAVLASAAILFAGRLGNPGMPLALACAEWSMALLGAALVYVHVVRRHVPRR